MLNSLNPFEIRASLKPQQTRCCPTVLSLNPFEIRASLKQYIPVYFEKVFTVLIPLKSGQA